MENLKIIYTQSCTIVTRFLYLLRHGYFPRTLPRAISGTIPWKIFSDTSPGTFPFNFSWHFPGQLLKNFLGHFPGNFPVQFSRKMFSDTFSGHFSGQFFLTLPWTTSGEFSRTFHGHFSSTLLPWTISGQFRGHFPVFIIYVMVLTLMQTVTTCTWYI